MKKAILMAALFVSSMAQAGLPNVARNVTVEAAAMDVVSTRYGFEDVQDVALEFQVNFRTGELSRVILNYTFPNALQPEVRNLKVESVTTDACGTKLIYARLEQPEGSDPVNGVRFSAMIEDFRNSTCLEQPMEKPIHAQVRQGFGFCGTMDATMELEGKPEAIRAL